MKDLGGERDNRGHSGTGGVLRQRGECGTLEGGDVVQAQRDKPRLQSPVYCPEINLKKVFKMPLHP